LQPSDHSLAIAQLQAFSRQERDSRQVRKALAVKLIYQGYRYEEISKILDISVGSLSKWKAIYEQYGLAGFAPQHKGRQSYLNSQQREEVLTWLQGQNYWELTDLEQHLLEDYGVVYESKQSYYDLFEAAGFSWQKVKVRSTAGQKEGRSIEPCAVRGKGAMGLAWKKIQRKSSPRSDAEEEVL